jgi:hypothetical protein
MPADFAIPIRSTSGWTIRELDDPAIDTPLIISDVLVAVSIRNGV